MNFLPPKQGGPLRPGLGTPALGGGPAQASRDKLATAIMNQGQGAPAFGGGALPDAAPQGIAPPPNPQPPTLGAQPQPRPMGGPQMRRPMYRQQQFKTFGG